MVEEGAATSAVAAAVAVVAGSMTCALVGAPPFKAQLRKPLGASQKRIVELMDFQRDAAKSLAGKRLLFHRACMSTENLESFPHNGSLPPRILESIVRTNDSTYSRQRNSSSYVPDYRESEVPVQDTERGLNADLNADGCETADNAAFVIGNIAVMPSGQEHAVSAESRPERLRTLSANLINLPPGAASTASTEAAILGEEAADIASAAAIRLREKATTAATTAALRSSTNEGVTQEASAAASAAKRAEDAATSSVSTAADLTATAAAAKACRLGHPPPLPTDKMLVVPHTGRLVEDFKEPGVMIAAYFELFPHGLSGHLDKRARL